MKEANERLGFELFSRCLQDCWSRSSSPVGPSLSKSMQLRVSRSSWRFSIVRVGELSRSWKPGASSAQACFGMPKAKSAMKTSVPVRKVLSRMKARAATAHVRAE